MVDLFSVVSTSYSGVLGNKRDGMDLDIVSKYDFFIHTKKLEGRYLFSKKKDFCIRMISLFFIFCLCGNLLSETEIISCSKIRFN